MIRVVSSSRSDESKYVVVPNFAIWYLKYLKIIASNKYTLKDSRYGDVSVVSFCYDGNHKSKLDYTINGNDWTIIENNIVLATFDNQDIKFGSYTITMIKNPAPRRNDIFSIMTIKMDSEYSGISSEITVQQRQSGKIIISLTCQGLNGEYVIDTTLPVGIGYNHPNEYFDRLIGIISPNRYCHCSGEKIDESSDEALQELELLTHVLQDKRLEETLGRMMSQATDLNYYYKRINIKCSDVAGKQDKLMQLDDERQINKNISIPSSDVEIEYHVRKNRSIESGSE